MNRVATDHLTDEQRKLLGGGAAPQAYVRPNMWGSQFVLPTINPLIPVVATPDKNFINIELEEPTELILDWHIDPLPAPGAAPTIVCKAIIGNGRSSYLENWAINIDPVTGRTTAQTIRRILIAQTLQVSANRTDAGNPDSTLHLWAARRVGGSKPVVIATEIVAYGAGVAAVTISNPPREATHVALTSDANSTNMTLLSTQPGSAEQQVVLLSNRTPQDLWAIDPRSNLYRLQRAAAANAGTCEIRWLR